MRARLSMAWLHRTLGSFFWLLFVMWFSSGIAMTFTGFPSVSERESLARAPVLRIAMALTPPKAAMAPANDVDLFAIGDRAVVRAFLGRTRVVTYADSGEPFKPLTEAEGLAFASAWLGARAHVVSLMAEADQWNPRARARGTLPLLHVALDDDAGTEAYVALAGAEVVQKTTRRGRLLAWIGAIPHWIYPTKLRQNGPAWKWTVIVLSGIGATLAFTGLVHGLRVVRIRRRSARGEQLSAIPFRDPWMRWHHIAGLAFGLFAFTWTLSGLFSVVDFGSRSDSDPDSDEVRAFRGGALDSASFVLAPGATIDACAAASASPLKRLSFARVSAIPYYVCRFADGTAETVRADADAARAAPLDRAHVASASRAVVGDSAVITETWLTEGDPYYYPSHFDPDVAFPVLRTEFANGTAVYAAPATASLERRYTATTRLHRWLYHGLHSWDFPAIYRHETLWHVVIIALLCGGIGLSLTGTVIALRKRRRGTVRA